jgi:FkbM family methyltransferase
VAELLVFCGGCGFQADVRRGGAAALLSTLVMPLASAFRGVGYKVYDHVFPIYRVCYGAFKAYADRAERQLLKATLTQGDVIVDAGANIGIYSQFLSRCVGPTGVVHSFEPSPNNFRHLQHATRKLCDVRLLQAAVGERNERAKLYVSNKLNVDHRTYATQGDSRSSLVIDVIAVDDYFGPGGRVDLIKMDIQGYELHCLHGANRVLADNPVGKLLLEFWPYGLKQVGAELNRTDWRSAEQKHGVPFRADLVVENPEWYVNLFASPK